MKTKTTKQLHCDDVRGRFTVATSHLTPTGRFTTASRHLKPAQ